MIDRQRLTLGVAAGLLSAAFAATGLAPVVAQAPSPSPGLGEERDAALGLCPSPAASPGAAGSPLAVASPDTLRSPMTVASPAAVGSPAALASPLAVASPDVLASPIGLASPGPIASPIVGASPRPVATVAPEGCPTASPDATAQAGTGALSTPEPS